MKKTFYKKFGDIDVYISDSDPDELDDDEQITSIETDAEQKQMMSDTQEIVLTPTFMRQIEEMDLTVDEVILMLLHGNRPN